MNKTIPLWTCIFTSILVLLTTREISAASSDVDFVGTQWELSGVAKGKLQKIGKLQNGAIALMRFGPQSGSGGLPSLGSGEFLLHIGSASGSEVAVVGTYEDRGKGKLVLVVREGLQEGLAGFSEDAVAMAGRSVRVSGSSVTKTKVKAKAKTKKAQLSLKLNFNVKYAINVTGEEKPRVAKGRFTFKGVGVRTNRGSNPGPTPSPDPDPESCAFSVSSSIRTQNADAAVAASGNFVVVWEDDRDRDGNFQIRAGSFTPDNLDLLDPFTVNTTSAGDQSHPAIALSDDESFVVVWKDDSNNNGLFEVRTRGFLADGSEKFPQFTVNVRSSGQQEAPDVASDPDGNFVVVWEDDTDSDGLYQIYARGFGPDGVERFSQFTVNTSSAGQQLAPAVSMAANGDFVVVWQDDPGDDGLFNIRARGFNADGSESFPQLTVNTRSAGDQRAPDVASAASGDFIVAWDEDRDGDGFFQVHARGFRASGQERIEQFTVNVFSAGQQVDPVVATDSGGNFAVAWEDDRDDDGEFHIRMRAFNADGSERMEHRKADCVEPAQHLEPAIAVSESGRVLVFWDDTLVGQSPRVSGRAFDE
mgnify:CR=1 FL=1